MTNYLFRSSLNLSRKIWHTAKTLYRKLETNVPKMKLRGFVPNSYIHVSVSDLFIPTIGLPILLQENRRTDLGNI
jgi:hypothetical protein